MSGSLDGMQSLSQNRADRRNIILITIDSLRADHCGFLGGDSRVTPTLDSLANNGIIYENAFAPGPRTPSSIPVSFTGNFIRPFDFTWGDWQVRWNRISEHMERHRTLPERLQDVGYSTIGITANPWTHDTGFDAGFDQFIKITGDSIADDGYNSVSMLSTVRSFLKRSGILDRVEWNITNDWFIQWPHYFDRVRNELKEVSEPYFLWVFLLDPHQPYLAPRKFRRESSISEMYYANFREFTGDITRNNFPDSIKESLRRAYRDSIRSADGFVAKVLNEVDEPLLIVHSDHGDAFGEHGTWGHHSKLYDENLHVPLMIHGLEKSTRVTDQISLRTLPDLIQAMVTEDELDPRTFTDDSIMSTTEGMEHSALRTKKWKLINNGSKDMLFNLEKDPKETANISSVEHEAVETLRTQLVNKQNHSIEQVEIVVAIHEITSRLQANTVSS